MKKSLKGVLIHEKAKLQDKGVVIEIMIPWKSLETANTTLPQLRGLLGLGVDLDINPTQGEMKLENPKKASQATNSPTKDKVVKKNPRGRPPKSKTNSQPRV